MDNLDKENIVVTQDVFNEVIKQIKEFIDEYKEVDFKVVKKIGRAHV